MTSYKINVTVKKQKNSMTLWHNINTISNKIQVTHLRQKQSTIYEKILKAMTYDMQVHVH